MAYLHYIDDDVLRNLVKDVLQVVLKKMQSVEKDFHKNVIDPFAALFESAISNISHDNWKNAEMVRQCQKTLTNHIGELHQKILGNVAGWEDLGTGGMVDLVSSEKKIIAEIKNKHNTVTGGKLADQYNALERLVAPKASTYKDYTAYFVNVIPQKPARFNKPFRPSDKDKGMKLQENQQIRIIDGASFYSLVTGREHALAEFYAALPAIIEDVFRNDLSQAGFTVQDKAQFHAYFTKAYLTK